MGVNKKLWGVRLSEINYRNPKSCCRVFNVLPLPLVTDIRQLYYKFLIADSENQRMTDAMGNSAVSLSTVITMSTSGTKRS